MNVCPKKNRVGGFVFSQTTVGISVGKARAKAVVRYFLLEDSVAACPGCPAMGTVPARSVLAGVEFELFDQASELRRGFHQLL